MTSNKAIFREVTEDVLMIALGVGVFLVPSGKVRLVLLVCLVIVALFACLEGVLRIVANADRIKSLKKESLRLSDELAAAKRSAKPEESKAEKPEVPGFQLNDLPGNTEKLQEFLQSLSDDGNLPDEYKAYFRNLKDLFAADRKLVIFKETISESLGAELGRMDLPLSEDDKKKIAGMLIRRSLTMLDYIDTYRFTINNSRSQLLSVRVATGEMSEEEALGEAKQATVMPDETPKNIRAIKAAVESLDLGQGTFLYSGYKL